MKTIYLTQSDFNKIKPIETFPNPSIIKAKYNGQICRIIVASTIKVRKPTKENCSWHSLKEGSYILTCESGHFPSDLLFTTKDKLYVDGLNIGANNGRNLGTASIGVIDLKTAVKILKENNFKVIENEFTKYK